MALFGARGRLTGPTGRSEDTELLVDTWATLLVVPRSLAERLELGVRRSQPVLIAGGQRAEWPVAEVSRPEVVGLDAEPREPVLNLMLDPQGPFARGGGVRLRDVHTGDPLADLGTLLCYLAEGGDPYARQGSVVQVTALPGFYTREQIIERDARRSGRDVSKIAFCEGFALYRTAVVVQQIYIRRQRGQTKGARFGAIAPSPRRRPWRWRRACRPVRCR